jgi:hypothetical protein
MPSTRPPFAIDIISGSNQVRDLFEIVGMVVTNFGGLEETLRYLEWQLQAYAQAAGMPVGTPEAKVQKDLTEARTKYLEKHRVLSKILKGIDDGLSDPGVASALGAAAGTVATEWQTLKATANNLGQRRNTMAHAAISMSGVSPVRGIGLFKPTTIKPLDDRNLINDIGAFRAPLGAFINKLTSALPFRDAKTVTFAVS